MTDGLRNIDIAGELQSGRVPEGFHTRSEPSFVGRRQELSVLSGFVTEVVHGQSGLLLMEAESGAGKTALLDQLATVVHGSASLQILRCEGDPNDMRANRCLADALGCRPTSAEDFLGYRSA